MRDHYTGLCIGGPYDGQNRVAETAWWRYSKRAAVPVYTAAKPEAVEPVAKTGEYRFVELGRNGFWMDADYAMAAARSSYPEIILAALAANYRPLLPAA